MTLIFPSGKKVSVAESATENIKLSEEGKYELLVNSKQKETYNSFFSVYENPRATLLVEDELNYETGLPIIRGEVQTFEESIKWKVDKIVSAHSSKAKTAAFYFFKKGQFDLEVIVTNEKGCSSSEINRIFLERASKATDRMASILEDLDQITRLEVDDLKIEKKLKKM